MIGTVTLLGFGEAASTFALAVDWPSALAFDIADRAAACDDAGVRCCQSAAKALAQSPLILSLVTAEAALDVASEAARHIANGALYCDMNSVAPETKKAAARLIEQSGGRYVDVAVMAPVNPQRLAVPLLIAGPAAEAAKAALASLGFTSIRNVGDDIGRASAIKMIRSVMVKGIEALTAEMILASRVAGVTDEVLASLDASDRTMSWRERVDYNLDRMLVHGLRRAAEMYESSQTLSALGIAPMMTENTVGWQQAIGDLGISPVPEGLEAKLAAIVEKMP